MRKKSFISVADRKLLDRQRAITLHYAEIAMNQSQLEAEALNKLQSKNDYTDDFLNY